MTTPLSQEQRVELVAKAKAATPGPWVHKTGAIGGGCHIQTEPGGHVAAVSDWGGKPANAAFIAAANPSTILSYEATVQALTVERDAALERVKACVQYLGPGRYQYGEWSISYDPPPIPVRTQDWSFTHRDFDASYEGPEDGWVSNGKGGRAASLDEAITEIDEREADHA